MRRFDLLLTIIAVAMLGLVAGTTRPAAVAQEATPEAMTAMATHPVVGAWRISIDLGGVATIPADGLFHADGTYSQEFADGSGLIGVWRPTGERSADLTLYTLDLVDDKLAQGEARLTVEVDETGTAMTFTGTFVSLFEDGSIDMAVEVPATATRLDVLPLVPLGTPVLPPDLAAAGTPAP